MVNWSGLSKRARRIARWGIIGTAVAHGAAMATVLGVGSYAAPSFLLLDRSLTGAVITAVVVAAMGAAVLGAMRNFFRRATPSSTKGLEQP